MLMPICGLSSCTIFESNWFVFRVNVYLLYNDLKIKFFIESIASNLDPNWLGSGEKRFSHAYNNYLKNWKFPI